MLRETALRILHSGDFRKLTPDLCDNLTSSELIEILANRSHYLPRETCQLLADHIDNRSIPESIARIPRLVLRHMFRRVPGHVVNLLASEFPEEARCCRAVLWDSTITYLCENHPEQAVFLGESLSATHVSLLLKNAPGTTIRAIPNRLSRSDIDWAIKNHYKLAKYYLTPYCSSEQALNILKGA